MNETRRKGAGKLSRCPIERAQASQLHFVAIKIALCYKVKYMRRTSGPTAGEHLQSTCIAWYFRS